MSRTPRAALGLRVLALRVAVCVAVVSMISPVAPALAQSSSRVTAPAISPAVRKAIVAAVCQGSGLVSADGKGCRQCPPYTPGESPLESIVVDSIHTGAFVNPGASEAYAALTGCDDKPNQFGGGVLLRKTGSVWRVVRYDAGLAPNSCQRFRYKTGTVLLVCAGGYGAQGYSLENIYAQYIGPRSTSAKSLLEVQSNAGTCQPDFDEMTIKAWKQVDIDADGRLDLQATVSETHAVRGADCGEPPSAKVVLHRLNFRFDGVRFTPTAASAPTVQCLGSFAAGTGKPGVYCPVA